MLGKREKGDNFRGECILEMEGTVKLVFKLQKKLLFIISNPGINHCYDLTVEKIFMQKQARFVSECREWCRSALLYKLL